ncbi:MAG: glutamine-hydrolyzing GMP synthase [Candidatus Riflebacteria bacterium]|nr:glutamine-hydrolyzing GMP synthase [Candidatus Riflebacteria bacterium]
MMKKVVVVDFGGQYTHLISNRIRTLGVFSEVVSPETFDPLSEKNLVGIIFSGGPHSVLETGHPCINFDLHNCPVPILGLCYGHQLLAQLSGGKVETGGKREYGSAEINITEKSRLFDGLGKSQSVWMSHGDHVSELPAGFRITASSPSLSIAAFESDSGKFFGVQFHPEVSHTPNGLKMLDRFLSICTQTREWTTEARRRQIVEKTKHEAMNRNLLLFLSGGVDSLVALAVCIEAVGKERVFSIHVDTGLMREGESEEIVRHISSLGYSNIELADACNLFLGRLAGIYDPEKKREIIGKTFVDVLNEKIAKYSSGTDWMLVQGTIYPDRIESGGSKSSAKIKTHHNRVPEIEKLIAQGRVLEPLCDLYKDEIRELGRELNLPEKLLQRHPFPGPGLGIRILASASSEAEDGYISEEPELDEICKTFSFKSRILPVKSVGVQGDGRTFLHPAALWCEDSNEFSWQKLGDCAVKIVNSLKTVNRVVFSPFARLDTVRLKASDVNQSRADLLRKVDQLVRSMTEDMSEIWQLPVISLPAVDENNNWIFVIRPVTSTNAMTADFFKMPQNRLREILREAIKIPGVGKILYDITSKPPATIEWE